MLLGTLEAGGTKMVMGLADADCHIIKRESCPTRLPEETLADIIAFFEPHKIDALGIATFGPVDLRPSSASFGSIINTPKLAWRNFPLYRRLKEALQVPCAIDTDVNGAALAEARMGAVKGLENCVYFTVGTGIGGGVLSGGRLVHGGGGGTGLPPRCRTPAPVCRLCAAHRTDRPLLRHALAAAAGAARQGRSAGGVCLRRRHRPPHSRRAAGRH